jgi:hypothetical protein
LLLIEIYKLFLHKTKGHSTKAKDHSFYSTKVSLKIKRDQVNIQNNNSKARSSRVLV